MKIKKISRKYREYHEYLRLKSSGEHLPRGKELLWGAKSPRARREAGKELFVGGDNVPLRKDKTHSNGLNSARFDYRQANCDSYTTTCFEETAI